MVGGLKLFIEHFEGMERSFVMIGGTACDLLMSSVGLDFRATKDLDIVLLVDDLHENFIERFWLFIHSGKYESHMAGGERPSMYRFSKPREIGYPFMIELLTRNHLDVPEGIHLTPIAAEGDLSSLSAILLEDAYYDFIVESRTTIENVPTVPAHCLIPLKARAHLDLWKRKQESDAHVKEHDVRKHRNDVFRLYRTLAPADRFVLPSGLKEDLGRFLDRFPPDSDEWPAIRDAINGPGLQEADVIIKELREMFDLSMP